MTLDIPDFEAWLQVRRTSPGDMLRIQTLDRYGVPSDDADFAGYLEGALVRYDDHGHHHGEVAVEDTSATGYVAAAGLAWQLGVPFADWWAAHPQYRRGAQAA